MDAEKNLQNDGSKQGDWPEDLWLTERPLRPEPRRPEQCEPQSTDYVEPMRADEFRNQEPLRPDLQGQVMGRPPMQPRGAGEARKAVFQEPRHRAGRMQPQPRGARPPRRRRVLPPQKRMQGRKIFFVFLIIFLILNSILLMPSLFIKDKYAVKVVSRDAAASKKADAILVFGAGIYEDGTATPVLRDRVQEAAALYFKGAGKKVLLSGDHGQKGYDEVKAMLQVALEEGIPEEVIFLDHAGFSTWDSLYRAKHIFGAETLCMVSQGYHLYRANFFADELEIDAWGVAAEKQVYRDQVWQETRELLARGKAMLTALFKPQAEILGPAIDLAGDGRVTWD